MIWFDYERYGLALWGVALVLTLIGVGTAFLKRDARSGLKFPAIRLESLRLSWRARLTRAPLILRCITFGCILAALARPQLTQEEGAEVEGIDIVIAMDVSGSMNAVDMAESELIATLNQNRLPPNRFNTAVQVIKDFIGSRQYDRVSLVVFGKESFLQFPLTLDYGVMLNILDQMELGDVSGEGTAIGNALAMSLSRLQESEAKSKLVILLTDGEDRGSNVAPRQVADLARDRGVPVFPILVGSEEQSWMPANTVDRISGQPNYQPVNSQVNPELLQDIAKVTQGQFYRASDSNSLSNDFRDILDSFEKSRLIDYAVADRLELFPYLVWTALVALMLELLLSTIVLRRYP